MNKDEEIARLAAELAAIKGQQAEPVAWTLRREVDQCGLVRYMTQAKYERQTDGIRSWYEPYKCARCSYQPSTVALVDLRNLLTELDDALEDLEIHGRHSDQGYRKIKDWYRKIALTIDAIDAHAQPK